VVGFGAALVEGQQKATRRIDIIIGGADLRAQIALTFAKMNKDQGYNRHVPHTNRLGNAIFGGQCITRVQILS